MGYYEFEKKCRENAPLAMDADGRQSTEESQKGKSPNEVIGKAPNSRKILTYEELQKHEKRCKAKPGNCPYTKVYNDVDDLETPSPTITKSQGFDRLAVAMTQLFALAADLAKTDMTNGSDSARDIVEVIEGGLDRIQELCKEKDIKVTMDEAKTKYIVKPPIDKE